MADKSRKIKKTADKTEESEKEETPIEPPKQEEKSVEEAAEEEKEQTAVEPSETDKEKTDQKKPKELETNEKETPAKTESKEEKEEQIQTEPTKEVKEEAKKEVLDKTEDKQKEEKPKKKDDKGKDFRYIVRIANTDVDGSKTVVYGLASIKGIGLNLATLLANKTGIDRNLKIGDLKDGQIEKIQNEIDNIDKNAPSWMLNHRKDIESGKDIHLVGPDIDMRLRDEINIMKKIRSYRGIRHERGLPVRGQRTRANNRKGLSLGVSKKRVQTQTTTK